MTEKEIVKIADIILSNNDRFDTLITLKSAFPRFSKAIERMEKRHTDNENFEQDVQDKVMELFVQDGNDPVHFYCLPGPKFAEYHRRARGLLNKERPLEDM